MNEFCGRMPATASGLTFTNGVLVMLALVTVVRVMVEVARVMVKVVRVMVEVVMVGMVAM